MPTGIYMLLSKRCPEKKYVGSAVSIRLRWMVHQSELIHKCHSNSKLQNHYNKYGKDDLYVVILKLCEREDLIHFEQHFIDSLQPSFNILKIAGSRLGSKHSIQTKLRMRRNATRKSRYSLVAGYNRKYVE